MVVRGRRGPFLLLIVSLMIASSASMASDFVTGLVVGQALSNNNGGTKQGDNSQGDTEFVDFNAAQAAISKEVWFQSSKWRREEGSEGQGRYFICPGKGEYRSYSGRLRCRVADTGFSGLLGGMRDAKELPLAEALTVKEGAPITLESLKVESRQLAVKYFIVPVKQTPVNIDVTEGSDLPAHKMEHVSAGQATINSPTEAEKKTQALNSLSVISAPEVALQWLESPAMKIIMMVIALVGVARGLTNGNFTMALMCIPLMISPLIVKDLFSSSGVTKTPAASGEGSWEVTPIALLGPMVVCVFIYFIYRGYRSYTDRVSDERIEVLLRQTRTAAAAAQRSSPVSRNSEPPSIDTLRERQQQSNTNEPVVTSSSAVTPEAQNSEPEYIQPGKRKIILD